MKKLTLMWGLYPWCAFGLSSMIQKILNLVLWRTGSCFLLGGLVSLVQCVIVKTIGLLFICSLLFFIFFMGTYMVNVVKLYVVHENFLSYVFWFNSGRRRGDNKDSFGENVGNNDEDDDGDDYPFGHFYGRRTRESIPDKKISDDRKNNEKDDSRDERYDRSASRSFNDWFDWLSDLYNSVNVVGLGAMPNGDGKIVAVGVVQNDIQNHQEYLDENILDDSGYASIYESIYDSRLSSFYLI